MASYLLRKVDDLLWRRVKGRAALDGVNMRHLLLWFLAKRTLVVARGILAAGVFCVLYPLTVAAALAVVAVPVFAMFYVAGPNSTWANLVVFPVSLIWGASHSVTLATSINT